ncbi:MAG: tripartite tricarboxylate transporter permease [Beijerinckiaceae bacterium]|nr:tripartite tricarboxylate transporter permease [Beijerinckiaceae bacterium]
MEVSMLQAAGNAFVLLMEPFRLLMLFTGVMMGLVIGLLPGIGGLVGLALLLPFTFSMDPYSAFALLLGLGAVTSTADTIPAVLFGVPGTSASQATVLDGLPMSKKGEAGRALAAAYTASLMGGIFGAFLMALALPLVRPIILYIGSPELLSLAVFGISSVAVLSGSAPLRGLTAGGFGIMLAMIGSDPQTGTLRWTMDTLYLWEGLPLVPAVLGLFALPELCDLAIQRSSITKDVKFNPREGMLQGMKDAFRHWWLVLRCSWIGAGFGAIPGIGGSVIDWLAYGHAIRSEKGAAQTFGRGDVRGVIAPESANNAKEGGALVPTVVFGVPGSAGMAILLGAFMIHGLVPGPDMVTKNLQVTYAMVWSIALANILGAGLCFAFSGYFAKLATLRYTLILPIIMSVTYVGAFQASRNWGDLYILLMFGVFGWVMKALKWPRPPLILGLILGDIIERYLFISIQRYGVDWFARPIVIFFFSISFLALLRPFLEDVKHQGGFKNMLNGFGKPTFRATDLFYVVLLGLIIAMMIDASSWNFSAKIVPMVVGGAALIFGGLSLLNQLFRRPELQAKGEGVAGSTGRLHMDLQTDLSILPVRETIKRAGIFFGWLVGFMASMSVIGLIPTVPVFVVLFMRLENREPWKIVAPMAVLLALFIYIVFDQLLTIPWPPTYLGAWAPGLKSMIPSL